MSEKVSVASRCSATIRIYTTELFPVAEQLDGAGLVEEGAQVLNACLELAKAYDELIKVLAQPLAPPARKQALDSGQKLPF